MRRKRVLVHRMHGNYVIPVRVHRRDLRPIMHAHPLVVAAVWALVALCVFLQVAR
jgi:hypothetical protein